MSFVTGSRLKIIPTPQIERCAMIFIFVATLIIHKIPRSVSVCRLYGRIDLSGLNAISLDTHQGDIKQVFKNTDSCDR
jgi:hypothetical protein